MAGQPKGIARRLSQVFVEIPSSALHKPSIPASSDPTRTVSNRKENALRASISQNTMSKSSKRKTDETLDKPAKRSKLETTVIKPTTARRPLPNATSDFPNGFVYCHQCSQKRDAALAVQCTREDTKSKRQCNTKYCGPCLKNRYGLVLQGILSTSIVPAAEKKRHASSEGYFFKCPRCEETCNCVRCRKAKGLQSTGHGNLTVATRKSGLQSAADLLLQDPAAAGPIAGKPVAEKKSRTVKSTLQQTASATSRSKSRSTKNPAHISTSAPVPTQRPLPKALWTPVRTHLSLQGAEARIYIREFALRFLPLSRSHHDELEVLSRSRRDFDDDGEDGDLEPWVSEGCMKALLIALLGMIEVDVKILSTTANALHQQVFLFKIVNTLSTLSTLPSLALPSPTPAPEHLLQNAPIIRTRSARTSSHTKEMGKETDWPEVVRTSQLVPAVSVLVDHALQGKAVRDALEEGAKDAKELTRQSLEMKKAFDRAEKERKEKEKAEMEQKTKDMKAQVKDKKAKGKGGGAKEKEKEKDGVNVQEKGKAAKDLEDTPTHTLTPQTALALALSSCAQRIIPLGRDSEGRVYWALTPGRGERDTSREYLTSNIEVGERDEGTKTKSHKAKSRSPWTPPSLSERASHKRWSWFIAVWGVRPGVEERIDPPKDDDCSEDDFESESDLDSESDEDKDKPQKTKTERPRWYAFSNPGEIFKLAEWVERKAGLDSRSSSSKKSKLRLASALPSRTASASTSHAVSSSNTHTSTSTLTPASSFHSSSNKLSKGSKFAASLLADEEMVSSSEADESESSNEDQSGDGGDKRGDDMDVDSPIDFDDTPRTPQLQSLIRELRAYAVLLKKRA